MAFRASEAFHVWTEQGTGDNKVTVKRSFTKDQIVPADVVKGKGKDAVDRTALVYDDGAN